MLDESRSGVGPAGRNNAKFSQVAMNILVFVKQVVDTKVAVECDVKTGVIRDEWNVAVMDPEGKTAVESAVVLKDSIPDATVTLVSLVQKTGEGVLRTGLTMGCDEAVRLWDDGFDLLHSHGKAVIFARVARILDYDLILTGTKSQDSGSGQVAALLAKELSIPCVSGVVRFLRSGRSVTATKRLGEGFEQQVEAPLPLVIAMKADDLLTSYPAFPRVVETTEKEIPCYDLSDIGLPFSTISEAEVLEYGPARFPSARPVFIAAPDSSLPGFERRERLRAGTMKKREGRLVSGAEDTVVEEVFQALLRGGWLSHLDGGSK
jgi:electron transfer flavoprotein beta subunit